MAVQATDYRTSKSFIARSALIALFVGIVSWSGVVAATYEDLLEAAQSLANDRSHREAVVQFQLAAELQPDSVEPRLGVTGSLLAMGQYDGARELATAVLEQDAGNPSAWLLLWTARLAASTNLGGDQVGIRGQINSLLEASEAGFKRLFAAFEGLELLRDRGGANRALIRLVPITPEESRQAIAMRLFEAILQTRDNSGRLELGRLYLDNFTDERMAASVVHTYLIALASRYPDAPPWILAHELLDRIEGHWRGYFGLGFWLLANKANSEPLIPLLQQALAMANQRPAAAPPDYPPSLWAKAARVETDRISYLLGSALLESGAIAEALPLLKSVAANRPEWPGVRNALGAAYQRLGRSSEAVRWYRESVDLSHRYPQAEAALSELIARLYNDTRGARTYFAEHEGAPQFTDITAAAGMADLSAQRVAWGDVNADGYDDLLLDGSHLLINNGKSEFTISTQWFPPVKGSNGGIWADWNNDGYLDLVVTSFNGNRLLRNDGQRLEDVTARAFGRRTGPRTEATGWGHLDGDGRPDLYFANIERPELGRGFCEPDTLWQNRGDAAWTEVSRSLGLVTDEPYCGRGVTWSDLDGDGQQEIIVSNYRLDPNLVWQRDATGWRDSAKAFGVRGTGVQGAFGHSIGSASGDINVDGLTDLIITNLAHPRYMQYSDKTMVLLNAGGSFDDSFDESGILFEESNADPALADIDNDGDLDLFVSSIYPNRTAHLYLNDGKGRFLDRSWLAGVRIANAWGVAFADFDRDGDMDLVVASGAGIRLLRNDSLRQNWLQVRIDDRICQRQGIGARVLLTAGGTTQTREVIAGRGTGSQDSLVQHFGLGPYEGPVQVEFKSSCGQKRRFEFDEINQEVVLTIEP